MSEFLPKRDFFGSMKDTEILFGSRNKNMDIFRLSILYFSSDQSNNSISAIYCFLICGIFVIKFSDTKRLRDFFHYAKMKGFFGVDKFLSWDFFEYKI